MNDVRPNERITQHVSVFRPIPDPALGSLCSKLVQKMENGAGSPTYDQLVGLAKALSSTRVRRKDFLSADLFGEPGWDILLVLFGAEAKGRRLTVTNLCTASQCPDTTAYRSLERLRQLDLIQRVKSPMDGRVIFIDLQPQARTAIHNYLHEVWSSLFGAH